MKLPDTEVADNLEDRISDDMKNRPRVIPYGHGPPILPVLLKVILQELTLVSACESLGMDAQAFITVVTNWELVDVEVAELARAFEKKFPDSEASRSIRSESHTFFTSFL